MSHFSAKVRRFYEDYWTLVEPYHDTVMEIANASRGGSLHDILDKVVMNIGTDFKYQNDLELYGVEDYWASTAEVAREMAGDCDDVAMLTSSILSNLGIAHYLVFGHLYDQNYPPRQTHNERAQIARDSIRKMFMDLIPGRGAAHEK